MRVEKVVAMATDVPSTSWRPCARVSLGHCVNFQGSYGSWHRSPGTEAGFGHLLFSLLAVGSRSHLSTVTNYGMVQGGRCSHGSIQGMPKQVCCPVSVS